MRRVQVRIPLTKFAVIWFGYLLVPQDRGSRDGVGYIEAFYSGSDWGPTSESSTMYRWMLSGHK